MLDVLRESGGSKRCSKMFKSVCKYHHVLRRKSLFRLASVNSAYTDCHYLTHLSRTTQSESDEFETNLTPSLSILDVLFRE